MAISPNEYLIRFDPVDQKLLLYYVKKENAPDLKAAFLTAFPLSELRSVPIAEAERRIGRGLTLIFPELLMALHHGRGDNVE